MTNQKQIILIFSICVACYLLCCIFSVVSKQKEANFYKELIVKHNLEKYDWNEENLKSFVYQNDSNFDRNHNHKLDNNEMEAINSWFTNMYKKEQM